MGAASARLHERGTAEVERVEVGSVQHVLHLSAHRLIAARSDRRRRTGREFKRASRHAESLYREWRQRVRMGLAKLQGSYVELYRTTGLLRVHSPVLVPGLLQTEGYAQALLSIDARFRGVPDDAGEAAAARVQRSQVIHEPGHRFVFLIEEAVLYYQLGDAEAMAAQLGYLLTVGALPQVSFGIIPTATRKRAMWPKETFDVHDDTLVSVELISAEVNVTQPSEIALYVKAFEQLRSMAVYGAESRALIVQAIDALG
ncbi:DUF5753 domain-containing protein [Streptomyces monashensis]|uniref:DUF5753 domain-containing protein n=1 Tax=Streptomyces monashensis TaxID=1678012 RepID=UPI003CCC2D36